MAEEGKVKRGTDIWLVLLIVVLVLAAGVGMWFFSVAISSRFDETNERIKGRSAQIMTAVINLRQDMLTRFPSNTAVEIRETAQDAKSPAVVPAPKKPADKKTKQGIKGTPG